MTGAGLLTSVSLSVRDALNVAADLQDSPMRRQLDGGSSGQVRAARLRRDLPARLRGGSSRWSCSSVSRRLRRLRDVGGVSERALHLRPVSLAVLLAGDLWGDSPHAWFGPKPAWWPALLPFSPALLILPFPGLFRFTCYYYRGAYYKAFWADPPSCAVGEPRKTLLGRALVPADPAERPPLLRSTSRVAVPVLLSYDVWLALWFDESGDRADASSASASARIVLRGQRRAAEQLHARLPLDAAPRRRRARTRSRSRRVRQRCYNCSSASTTGTCCSPGAACSRWRSPTSTSASARWASGPTVRIL